ncbi:DHA2 family efflux MFS transporter permease subunit [Lentilactobacillus sp. Marseille-Q4993]|uniref:DHA2 family efflux MFS transporter permease subunit n=1 Tax=Lentilactobacillus sp. Marseille-Q4993 TaxID=3039492 RepID=UPI0024BC996D|nr:DHA2 family efflux MFS transporter permease subunit [Lentilactobacillus sp. Marseille-Q4993]
MNNKISTKTYLALLSAALLSFTGILTETSMNVTYPELSQQFHVSLDIIQWITTGYLLMVTIVMATTAYLLKRFLARSIHAFAATTFIIGDILCAISPSFPILLIGRLIQAIATGLSTPIMFQLIFAKIPRAKLGTMTGVAGMVISFAPALGPTYGGIISSTMSWRMIFWLVIPIVLISLVLGHFNIDMENAGINKSFDILSLLLLAITFTGLVLGVSWSGSKGIFNGQVIGAFIIAILALIGFLYSNNHGNSQLFDLTIFKFRPVWLGLINYFFLQFINIGISFLIPVYAQYVLHANALVAGLVLLPGSLVGAFTAPFAGKLADNKGYAVPIILGDISITLGALLFFSIQNWLTSLLVTLVYVLLRFGFNLSFSNNIGMASTQVPPQNSADVNSVFNMMQQYAGSIGVGIMAAIVAGAQNMGTGSLATRTYNGGQIGFAVLTILGVIGLVAAILNFNYQKRNQQI